MTQSIPVIDLSDHVACAPGALAATARAIQEALTGVGFFIVIGHGVPEELIARTFDYARRLHDLPMERKVALRLNEHNNGYMAMGRYAVWTSDVNANDKPDLNEAFFIKRERPPEHPMRAANRRFAGANMWPDDADLPGFRDHILTYYQVMDRFTRGLLPAVARALGMSDDFFAAAFDDNQSNLRLSHYPPVPTGDNQFGIAPHTDANFMTFLPQSEVPGLQVRMPDLTWLDVPVVPGSFAVNSGDTLRRWSNARFKSTPHRALPPRDAHRYAAPFFMAPHLDARIECLPSCAAPDNPPRWEPISYEGWITKWTDANYDPKVQRDIAA
jgi:isopenicillin N synthase-like dioxygenase